MKKRKLHAEPSGKEELGEARKTQNQPTGAEQRYESHLRGSLSSQLRLRLEKHEDC